MITKLETPRFSTRSGTTHSWAVFSCIDKGVELGSREASWLVMCDSWEKLCNLFGKFRKTWWYVKKKMKNKIISSSRQLKLSQRKITFHMFSCGCLATKVMHTYNVDSFSQNGDVATLTGWKDEKHELKGWISVVERVQRWKELKIAVSEYRQELQEEQMGYPAAFVCDSRNDTVEDTHEDEINGWTGWGGGAWPLRLPGAFELLRATIHLRKGKSPAREDWISFFLFFFY